MAQEIKPGSSRIKYDGVLDWAKLYSLMRDWLVSKKYDFYEVKNVRKPGSYGNEVEYEVEARRKETPYTMHIIKIKIKATNVEDIEIATEKGKEKKTRAGMMIIDVEPILVLNWQTDPKLTLGPNTKKEGAFQKKTREFIHKHIMRRYIDKWRDKVYYEAYQLQTKIKEELNLTGKYSAY